MSADCSRPRSGGPADTVVDGVLPGGNYTVTGGVLNIGGLLGTIGKFQDHRRSVQATTGKLTSHVNFDIQGGTVQAALAGTTAAVGLDKTGVGTATLAGSLLYTGNTTVYEGTLIATAINTPAATIWVGTGGTLTAPSIVANSLVIGGTPAAVAANAAVPEPSTLLLLVLAGLALAGAYVRRK